jgi:hypothetical protein
VKYTPDQPDRAERLPPRPGASAANGCTPDEPGIAREALKAFVRSLARAAAIEDYRRHNGEGQVDHEGSNLRSFQL